MRDRRYYVYMLTSSSRRALYTGVTNNIYSRHPQHLNAGPDTFTGRYRTFRLVYVETFHDIRNAIRREKEIKGWTRAKKDALIRSVNPGWKDLSRLRQAVQTRKSNARSFAPEIGRSG